jgi:hypothetical protein
MSSKLQKERSKNVVMMIDEREGLLPSSKVVGNDCWQEKNFKRLQKKSKTLSFIPVNDSRTNHIKKTGNDTI